MKNTSDVLCKLDATKFVPNNAYFVFLDVKSLNSIILSVEGIKAVKESFDNNTSKNVATRVKTTFSALSLTLNNFVFNSKHYLQIKGCVKGTICAPSYANMFVDHFKKKYIYSFLQGISLIYLRFIDNIFFIWTGTKEPLTNCLNNLNKKRNSINFEYKIS